MTKPTAMSFSAVAIITLAFGACNGELTVDSTTGALDGGGVGGGGGSTPQNPIGIGDPTNAEDCPAASPEYASACTAAEGRVCRYTSEDNGQHSYFYCGCWEAGENDLIWSCYGTRSDTLECPSAPPVNATSCSGLAGAQCSYPQKTTCVCPLNEAANWDCYEASGPLPAPPAVDGTTPIDQLSDAERQTWCEWYLTAYQPPNSSPSATPLSPDGWTTNTGCTNGAGLGLPMCDAVFAQLPVEYCKGNLSLSTCQAPLSELTDCVLTVMDACWPSPHGCARYLEKPGCGGTMAIPGAIADAGMGAGLCSIKVQ